MRCRFLACITLVCAPFVRLGAAPPPGYYTSASGLTGPALKAALHDVIDGHTVIPYDQLFPALYAIWEDPGNSSNVRLIYGGVSVAKTALTWNREHLWPRSRGVDDTGPDTSDLFHVVPCDEDVNIRRSNLIFDFSSALDGGIISPGHPEAPLTTRDSNSWEPPPNERGDIARALFYLAVRYDGTETLTTDLEVVNGAPIGPQMAHLDSLLYWHNADPPDDAERARNDRIFTDYQHNRNPFIDHPEWVAAIWGAPPTQIVARSVASDATATESPLSTGHITIQLNIPASPGGITIPFATAGSAQATEYSLTGNGVSYNPNTATGSVFIPGGATTAMVILSPITDSLSEGAESMTLSLSPAAGYTVTGAPANITISDTPPPPPAGSIATWAFDSFAFPFQVPSDTGLAFLDWRGWTGEVQSFTGVSGQSFVLEGDLGNGSHIDFQCSTLGVGSLVLNFQTRGSSTGFNVGTWSWSIDGTTFNPMPGVNTATRTTSFSPRTVDFSAITSLNHAANVTFRYTLDGATSEMGNNRIDNFSINAAPLPSITLSTNASYVKEGASSPVALTLSSSVPAPVGGLLVSVKLTGTAAAGTDYSLGGVAGFDTSTGVATIGIPAGGTSASFQVAALADSNPLEFDESVGAQVVMDSNRRYVQASTASVIVTLGDRTPYNVNWAARFPSLQPSQAAPLDDPDEDGRTNLEEFAADADPLNNDGDFHPSISTLMLPDPSSGGALRQFVVYSFIRRIDENAPIYRPQSSLEQINWNEDLVFVESIPGPSPATERVKYRLPMPLSAGGTPAQWFIRLRIDALP